MNHRKSIGHLNPDTGQIVSKHRKGNTRLKILSTDASDHCIVAATGIEKLLDHAVVGIKPANSFNLKAVFPDDWKPSPAIPWTTSPCVLL